MGEIRRRSPVGTNEPSSVGGQVKHSDVLQPIQHRLHSQRREEEAEDLRWL
jgi:hypothetical protein